MADAPLTPQERALVAAHLARRGVTRCPTGAAALQEMEIAPGLGLGDLTKGQLSRWYYRRGRAAAMARERVRPRLEPLEAELGLRPTVQPLAGGRAEG